MNVLVVDSSEEGRGMVIEALQELTNVRVQGSASSLRGAITTLEGCAPDVVVSDCDLPDGDCVGVIEAARKHAAAPAVVVFSGSATPEQRERCLAAGADRFVHKEAGIEELQRAVTDLAHG